MALLVTLAFIGLIYWFLADRPQVRGRFGSQRVYQRRGPGLGGIALVIFAVVYLSSHADQVETVLLMIGVTTGVGVLTFSLVRRAFRRNR
jgi:UDP-N-acetylmuramyl pentapeptide phosphotransferase/UDP-N-acetylglucosamine-1-phosphate transferase